MKTRLVRYDGNEFIVDEQDGKDIVRGFELLAIADFDTALMLLSLEMGRNSVVLLGSMKIARDMRDGKPMSWDRWQTEKQYFPLA